MGHADPKAKIDTPFAVPVTSMRDPTLVHYNQNLLLRLVEIHIRVKQVNFLDGSVEFCVRELDWYLDSG
jgi:hypothetical protein